MKFCLKWLGCFFCALVISGLPVGPSFNTAYALNCHELNQLLISYLKMHYSYSVFDDELSKRTLDTFIKSWDPAKLYFFQADVDDLNKRFGTKLDTMLGKADASAKPDCSAVDAIMNLYSQRFVERQKYILQLLDEKFDFSKDEYLVVDTKQMGYAPTTEEVNERWRKRVKFQVLTLKNTLGDVDKSRAKIKKRYELALKRHNELTKDKVLGVFLNAFATSLDPHSNYMPAEELEDFRIRTRLSLEGIGAQLRSDDGFTIVASLVKGGAAQKSNLLKENDKIIAVAQGDGEPVDVIDMDLPDVVKLIRGARGTTVKLTVMREESDKNSKVVVPIVREKIQLLDQQASSHLVEVVADEGSAKKTYKVGVIVLPSFYIDFEGRDSKIADYRSSSADTIREINKLKAKDIDALVMDLRSNGGGGLDESIRVAGLFFDEGPVVQVKGRDEQPKTYADSDGITYYSGPLVVMINRNSASASEIFAGAIQDYKRGLIIGDSHTFGKGTVQNLNDLGEKLGAIKVTVNMYYRASGASTQLNGVAADIRLPSLGDELEIGEKYYDYALPYDKIKELTHQDFGETLPYVPTLQKASDERIAHSKEFTDVLSEIKKYKDNKEERSRVSLMDKDNAKDKLDKKKEEKKDKKEKKKDGKKDKAEEEYDEMEGKEFNLSDDLYLQEGVRIATQYTELLKKAKSGTKFFIKGVDDQPKKAELTEQTKASDAAKGGKKVGAAGSPAAVKK